MTAKYNRVLRLTSFPYVHWCNDFTDCLGYVIYIHYIFGTYDTFLAEHTLSTLRTLRS